MEWGWRQRVFLFVGIGAAVTSLYHTLAAAGITASDGASVERHLVFIAVSLLVIGYCRHRPLWLLPALALLVAQQTMSHGERLLSWYAVGAVDWVSAGVLCGLYALFAAVLFEARDNSPRVARILCPFGVRG